VNVLKTSRIRSDVKIFLKRLESYAEIELFILDNVRVGFSSIVGLYKFVANTVLQHQVIHLHLSLVSGVGLSVFGIGRAAIGIRHSAPVG
jgi:hypothetical protein